MEEEETTLEGSVSPSRCFTPEYKYLWTTSQDMLTGPPKVDDHMIGATEFHLFPRLPPEIREQIWKAAIPGPRLLFLDIHLKRKEDPLAVPRSMYPTGYDPDMLAPLFTSVTYTYNIIRDQDPEVLREYNEDCLFPRSKEEDKLPPAPALLYVNRETRNLMEKDGYELAFAGRYWGQPPHRRFLERWKRLYLDEKRIWVNFSKDIFFIEGWMRDVNSYERPRHDYRIPDELKRIQRLCLRSDNWAHCFSGLVQEARMWDTNLDQALLIKGLKELLLFHIDRCFVNSWTHPPDMKENMEKWKALKCDTDCKEQCLRHLPLDAPKVLRFLEPEEVIYAPGEIGLTM
jgi:hypothetical protein